MFDQVYWCINDCLRYFWELLLYPICDLIYRNYSTRMSRYIVNDCMNLISLWLLFLRWALWLIGLVSVISLFEDNTVDPSKFTILKYFRNSSLWIAFVDSLDGIWQDTNIFIVFVIVTYLLQSNSVLILFIIACLIINKQNQNRLSQNHRVCHIQCES